jgi:hypothetical protein
LRLVEQLLQKRAAPPTTRSRAKTLGELAGPLGFFHPQEIHHFPPGDVKAKAKLVVEIHGVFRKRSKYNAKQRPPAIFGFSGRYV